MTDLVEYNKQYHPYLSEFMAFLHPDAMFDTNSVIGIDLLAEVKPNDVARFLRLKAFGTADPTPDMQPHCGRANSLGQYKKAISYYVRVIKSEAWNERIQDGNPTRSAIVNDVIKRVKRQSDIRRKYLVPAAAKFQFHMMARIDDTSHFDEADLKPHPQFPFALQARMCWSKNVREERDAPDQIILGAMDIRYCVLLSLGIYLETWCNSGLGATNNFLFGSSDKPKRTKEFMYNVLRKLWDSDGFVPEAMGPLGTHSLRKFPATYARRNGCTKDDVDARGRWRRKRVSDVYMDVNLPYPDAKVASILCVGGPCKYVVKEGSGVTDQWLGEHVVPSLLEHRRIHRSVSLVLARPILWACFDARMESAMPVELRTRIREAYAGIRVLEADVNPVDRVLLVVTGYENQVHIDEIVGEELGEEDANGTHIVGGTRGGMVNAQHFRALYAQNVALRREVQELRDSLEVFRNSTRDFMHRMNSNITRIGIQPARVRRPDAGGAAVVEEEQQNRDNVGGMDRTATLSRTPRDLHILWHEYEFGLGGRKPARLFTPAERGRCKYLYHRRKVVWDQIASMIRAGHTAQSAIDYLYYQYGRDKPVTQIINDMRRHRMRDRNNLGYHV
ncbi:hypothetical protein MHU86_15036 [Fragilaria crotonensis]|nr:hypothetical protein MHU86_15036 [Fragilaria crotonensis]